MSWLILFIVDELTASVCKRKGTMILASPAPKTFLGFCAFSCSRCVSKLNGISMVNLNGPRREKTCLQGF